MEEKKEEKRLDATGVLSEIVKYRETSNLSKDDTASGFGQKLSAVFWLAGIIVVLVTYFAGKGLVVIPANYISAYLIVFLVSLVAMLANIYRDMAEIKDFLKDPTTEILKLSDHKLRSEIKLCALLDEYPTEAVIQARDYFRRRKTIIESVSSMLVGVINKVGLLPALFAIVVMVVKVNSDGFLSPIVVGAFVLIGIYCFCFRLVESSVKFEEYQLILSDYVEIRRSRG